MKALRRGFMDKGQEAVELMPISNGYESNYEHEHDTLDV